MPRVIVGANRRRRWRRRNDMPRRILILHAVAKLAAISGAQNFTYAIAIWRRREDDIRYHCRQDYSREQWSAHRHQSHVAAVARSLIVTKS